MSDAKLEEQPPIGFEGISKEDSKDDLKGSSEPDDHLLEGAEEGRHRLNTEARVCSTLVLDSLGWFVL